MSENKAKNKSKNTLNLIDVFLIVLIVLVAAVFLSYRFIVADNTVGSVELQYTVHVRNVSEQLNTSKLLDDRLYDHNGIYMGTVNDCGEIEQSKYTVMTENANYVQTTSYFNVTIRCKATRMKNGSYHINGSKLQIGDQLTLTSEDFSLSGDCIEITEVAK